MSERSRKLVRLGCTLTLISVGLGAYLSLFHRYSPGQENVDSDGDGIINAADIAQSARELTKVLLGYSRGSRMGFLVCSDLPRMNTTAPWSSRFMPTAVSPRSRPVRQSFSRV